MQIDKWSVLRGDTQELLAQVDFSSAEERFGSTVWAIHRVDLHNELLRLAVDKTGPGSPIQIHLASEVIGASDDGTIVLQGDRNTVPILSSGQTAFILP